MVFGMQPLRTTMRTLSSVYDRPGIQWWPMAFSPIIYCRYVHVPNCCCCCGCWFFFLIHFRLPVGWRTLRSRKIIFAIHFFSLLFLFILALLIAAYQCFIRKQTEKLVIVHHKRWLFFTMLIFCNAPTSELLL